MFRLFGFSALIHAYIGWRLLPDMPFAALAATGAWLAISTVLIPASLLGRRRYRAPFADRLAWAGLLAIGAFSSLLVLTVLRDVALLFAWAAGGWLFTAAALAQFGSASAIAVPVLAGHCNAGGTRQRAPAGAGALGRRPHRRSAGGIARLHDRADQRHPHRIDDQARLSRRRSSTR